MLKQQGEQALRQVEEQGLLTFDSKESRLQAILDLLVSTCLEVDKRRKPPRRFFLVGRDLKLYEDWLVEAHRYFNEASRQNAPLTNASEWVLDNYYVLHQAVQEIKEDMPSSFYFQLPVLIPVPITSYPRIYFIAYQILKLQNYLLEMSDLRAILIPLQEEVPLTMGELWALPIFLRYCLIEKLANALLAIIHPSRMPVLPTRIFTEASTGRQLQIEEVNDNEVVANIVISLRTISEQDWKDFFEEVSRLERTLREEPSGLYACMDFATRDLYRKEIEKLSFASGRSENELAEALLQMDGPGVSVPANSTGADDEFQAARQEGDISRSGVHIGEFLLGERRGIYEKRIGYEPGFKTRISRWTKKNASGFFIAINLLIAGFLCVMFLRLIQFPGIVMVDKGTASLTTWSFFSSTGRWFLLIGLFLLFGIAALSIASSLVNWMATLIVGPRILPKLDFTEEIPDGCRTLVVIPGMIHSHEDVDSLVQQIELHYLRNLVAGLSFALLTDFRDADFESQPEDDDLIDYANQQVEKLNAKYGGESERVDSDQFVRERLFYFLHRKRLWNPAEGKWMGWERKRGKLHELNLFLRGKRDLSFITLTDEMYELKHPLQNIRFVITLDADTVLPREAACRLVGTLAHPLNRAVFDPNTGQVTSGYTILQPRMEIFPRSIGFSWFTRIFAGDAGLDLYTLAVSDAYQDLFGEGIYVGKGIYDVDAFTRSVNERIQENTILSHDLLEGLMGRAGLVTDITMVEDYPQNYIVQAMRQRRWIRGDWQLIPWLFRARHFGVVFSAIDHWKIFDNLRRSLLPPALFLLFVLGMIFLPGLGLLWTTVFLLTLGIPVLTGFFHSSFQVINGGEPRLAFRPFVWSLARGLLAVAFLPYEAYFCTDAVITTLYRLLISRRHLLQWTTAAQTARMFGLQGRRNISWLKMNGVAVIALALTLGIQGMYSLQGSGAAPVLLPASPILLLWMISPVISWRINLPLTEKVIPLDENQVNLLRQLARRTWGFFERFAGPEDHWLPPDNFQESPVGAVAHRTSPTNIGLLLVSMLAAYDLGYLNPLGLVTRLKTTMETLLQLERQRGHFMNWYDTMTLQPLNPRYISTVDSGNMAACLIITAQACRKMPDEPIFRWELWLGYLDSLSNLADSLSEMYKPSCEQLVDKIRHQLTQIHDEVMDVKDHEEKWYPLFLKTSGAFWQELSQNLMELIKKGGMNFDLKTLEKLQEITSQTERHHLAVQRTITELVPWIPFFSEIPELLVCAQFDPFVQELRNCLPNIVSCRQVHERAEKAKILLGSINSLLQNDPSSSKTKKSPTQTASAREWLEKLSLALNNADANSQFLLEQYSQVVEQSEKYVDEMDFSFLYHSQRQVFHIGYNPATGQLDQNFYDLLASEARITSIIAIAKAEVPQSHWLHLGRPVTHVDGSYILLSWSGTMFEYMMPPLFFRSLPGTLLSDSTRGAVFHQIEYGRSRGVPWGISESGFYRFDANQNYQYRAFGVPGLGFKRGLGDDLVIAPYASIMAISCAPQAVLHNLVSFKERKMLGLYGLYEAVDFTHERLMLDQTSAVIYEYMAHHQGMIMMALANYLNNDIMIQRMHSDSRIKSVELLLQEQIPRAAPIQDPYSEDVKGVQRLLAPRIEVSPWKVPVQTPIPQTTLLSNGSYNVIISNAGGGYSTWRDIDLTRWQADGVLDPWGSWVYLQDMQNGGKLWSASFQPIPGDAANCQVTFFAHMAAFRRIENGIASTMEVTVSPEDAVELRRLQIHNTTNERRDLRLVSYGEVILTRQKEDTRHPAFNKLFIESEFVPELNLQIFKRRPRSNQETGFFLGHMLVTRIGHAPAEHEADRNKFIGRGNNLRHPQELNGGEHLSGTSGATFDTIFSLGREVKLEAHESEDLAFLTLAADSREELIGLARRYQVWTALERTFRQSETAAQTWMSKQEIGTQEFKNILQIFSALLYPFKAARAQPETLAANKLGQNGLWRFGISGDYPILLLEVDQPDQLELVQDVLEAHKFFHSRRFLTDLVILNRQKTDYGAEVRGNLYRLITRTSNDDTLNQNGGIFILHADQITPEEDTLLRTAAKMVLYGKKGSLTEQMPGYSLPVHHLPDLVPSRAVEAPPKEIPPISGQPKLEYFNEYGGFTKDGREYVIQHNPGMNTPAPWVNVIGYPQLGFIVSESGSQCTWAVNSGENRLTPWSNDPVCDPSGEIMYLRDEETGEVWTPTPKPAGRGQFIRVVHGAGYSTFEHESHGLHQQLMLFASPEDPVKIALLKVENRLDRPRRITATQFVEWVLGTTHSANASFILPEYHPALECLLASNPYNTEFASRVAFMIASKPIHGMTADRAEFLGRSGNPAAPAGLHRIGLERRVSPGEDPCGVLQVHLDLLPGGKEEIYFVLGQGNDRKQALVLARKYHNPDSVGIAYRRTQAFWDHLLGTIQVKTPDPAVDVILNRWMLYQALSCRIWGRSGFYQSSGAFGFRDQLQDVLSMLAVDPTITRSQILNAARQQFTEGDVLHWWHPPSGRGVRTHFSDDLLWLPYVTAQYIETTGDDSILDEKVPFLNTPLLKEGEEERYGEFQRTETEYSLMEHCMRAIQRGTTKGKHKLPLIGTGDWNDGFNRVGKDGKGESVWLAWFLCDVLNRFADVCEKKGETLTAANYREQAKRYASAVEKFAWDGDWYCRAFFDNGDVLGSSKNAECQIDAIAQSWSLISGMENAKRSRLAMKAVNERLIRPEDRLLLLFTPPFDKGSLDPGYIKGYAPGIRENGGQYTHAAVWTAWAISRLGEGKQANELFNLLNPILQADTQEKAECYRVEPYVICADIYSVPPNVRRGGWSWYTGSAAWMYRLGVEEILGFHKTGGTLRITPTIPPEWPGYEIRYCYGETCYWIKVSNPEHVSRGVKQVMLDDQLLFNGDIPLSKDKKEHRVDVIMGK